MNDIEVVDMANPDGAMDSLEEVASRGEQMWWLEASRCSICGTGWLVGHEERQNDVFVLRRLSGDELSGILQNGSWPTDFDQYEVLLRLGRDAGHSVQWLEPITDSSLLETVVDLAKQRPGVSVSELCALLNLDRELALRVAELAQVTSGAHIINDLGVS